MNKRQKKKVIKRALDRLGTEKFTKKDKQILFTIGRNDFKKRFNGLEPEVIDNIPEVIDTVKKVWNGIIEAVANVFINLGDAFKNIGRSMQGGTDKIEQDNYTVAINDIEPVHASEQGKQVFRGEEQKECHVDMPRIHLPSHARRL